MEPRERRVESLEEVRELIETRGKEHGVQVIICRIDGVHRAADIADGLTDFKERKNWEIANLDVIYTLSSLYGPLFLAYGLIDVIQRHRHDNGFRAVKQHSRDLKRQGCKVKSMELGLIAGTHFGQVPLPPVPQAGHALGDRVIELCNDLLGVEAESGTRKKKPVLASWFDDLTDLADDIKVFVESPVYLPAAPDAASEQVERPVHLPAAPEPEEAAPDTATEEAAEA